MTQTTNDEIKALCVKADALAVALSERYDMYLKTKQPMPFFPKRALGLIRRLKAFSGLFRELMLMESAVHLTKIPVTLLKGEYFLRRRYHIGVGATEKTSDWSDPVKIKVDPELVLLEELVFGHTRLVMLSDDEGGLTLAVSEKQNQFGEPVYGTDSEEEPAHRKLLFRNAVATLRGYEAKFLYLYDDTGSSCKYTTVTVNFDRAIHAEEGIVASSALIYGEVVSRESMLSDEGYNEDLKKHDHEFAKDVIRHIAQKFCERLTNVRY